MNRMIKKLENNGFVFKDEEDKEDFKNYITSNTTWEILEQSKRLMKSDKLNFSNIRNAGLCDYYINKAIFPVINQFEHVLKVHMNFLYTKSDGIDKQKINDICKNYNYKYKNKNKNKKVTINKLSDVFLVATLTELIKTYNSISNKFPSHYKNFERIEQVGKLRNIVYHNKNVIEVFTPKKPNEHIRKNVSLITDRYALKMSDVEKNFVLTPNKNLYLALCVVYYTDIMLSQSYSTQKIKHYTFEESYKNIERAEKYYSNIEIGDKCVLTYLAILKRINKQIIRISLDYKM